MGAVGLAPEAADVAKLVNLNSQHFVEFGSDKETRMNRLMEDNERYKIQIKDTKTNSRDQLTVDRRETDRMMTEIKK